MGGTQSTQIQIDHWANLIGGANLFLAGMALLHDYQSSRLERARRTAAANAGSPSSSLSSSTDDTEKGNGDRRGPSSLEHHRQNGSLGHGPGIIFIPAMTECAEPPTGEHAGTQQRPIDEEETDEDTQVEGNQNEQHSDPQLDDDADEDGDDENRQMFGGGATANGDLGDASSRINVVPMHAVRARTRSSGSRGSRTGGNGGGSNRNNKPSRYYCFTWNNPPDQYEDAIENIYNNDQNDVEYIVYGREVGESGTFHLQGFVQFGEPIEDPLNDGPLQRFQIAAHWSKARRVIRAREYCKKDGDFVEHGTFYTRQGKRSDLDEFKDATKAGGMNMKRAREEHSEIVAKYERFAREYINDKRVKPSVPVLELYPWQKALKQKITTTPDPREIIFVVDHVGNSGKSYIASLITSEREDAQYMSPGKVPDMAYALDEDIKILLMDCPRSRQELFQYDFVEYIKNQRVFSTKYESRMKLLNKCHVIVFMNEMPDRGKLSTDRFTIVRLDKFLVREPNEVTANIENWQQLLDYTRERDSRETRDAHRGPQFPTGAHSCEPTFFG